MSRKEKRPSHKFNPAPTKTPGYPRVTNWMEYRPAWRIKNIRMNGPFGWDSVEQETILEIKDKLGDFENKTLNEILVKEGKRNHHIEVEKLCSEAQQDLKVLGQFGLVEKILSLHLSGKERVWGILNENVVSIIWWDPNHSICPSNKKHT